MSTKTRGEPVKARQIGSEFEDLGGFVADCTPDLVHKLFRNFSHVMGAVCVRLRRLWNVAEQFHLAATAQNLKRLMRFLAQHVIVSIVGYFFLIGEFGIRVGDRVQVGGVTGEVVDIGLVRFHLMELGSGAAASQPTGRVVAFSNAIVFQATAGLFKQIPGTNFIWHEIELTFAPESDYRVVRDRVDKAVDNAFAEYRENMERQRRQMEMSLTSISATELKPKARIHFTPSAIEVVIRFPVVLQKAAEIDDRIMRELFAAVDREPKLKLVGSEIPTVKAEA